MREAEGKTKKAKQRNNNIQGNLGCDTSRDQWKRRRSAKTRRYICEMLLVFIDRQDPNRSIDIAIYIALLSATMMHAAGELILRNKNDRKTGESGSWMDGCKRAQT